MFLNTTLDFYVRISLAAAHLVGHRRPRADRRPLGGTGRPQEISETDRALAEAVAPTLRENNILFVGLDVIGEKITEINITSPTCVREIEGHYNINIMASLFDAIEKRLTTK